jgi:hypothetical protein
MVADDIDIGRNSVKVPDVVGVIRTGPEPDVVGREVAFELQVVVDDLLEYVFLHRPPRTGLGRVTLSMEPLCRGSGSLAQLEPTAAPLPLPVPQALFLTP